MACTRFHVTREKYQRSLAPYPHPHYPHIMIGVGPIMGAHRTAIQWNYLQQVIDGENEL